MSWLAALAAFLGQLLAALIPAIGKEMRKNNRVEMKGGNRETRNSIRNHITGNANRTRLRDVHANDDSTP